MDTDSFQMIRQELKVGIAGYGVVGKRRRKYIDEHPNLTTIAVCDQGFSTPGRFSDGIAFYPTYVDLIKEPLDILFVSLPNYLAPEVTITGLEHDLHVFCEKPPGRDVEDVIKVMNVEARHPGLVLKYGFNHRYHDSVRAAQQLIQSGELGDIINLRGVYGKSKIIPFSGGWRAERRYAGGGILLDQGIHMLDLMRLFCGEFEEVKSFISNRYWNHDVEDNAYAIMRDKSGRIAMLHSSATQWEHRFRLEIAMTRGSLELSGLLTGSKSYGEESLLIQRTDGADNGTQRFERIKYLEDVSWRGEIQEFANAILNDEKITHGMSTDALATMKLVYQVYWADEKWRNEFVINCPDI